MAFRIEYQPAALSYDEFHQIDAECFPDEPVDDASFLAFLKEDFWAAWEGGALAGYCSAHQKGSLAWIRRIGVAGSYRRRGAGRQLMHEAITHFSKLGAGEVMLYVRQDNLPALCLYEEFGFEKAETTYQYIWKTDRKNDQDTMSAKITVSVRPVSDVPEVKMPDLPPQWADFRDMHNPPDQYALVFLDENGDNIGYCRLSPEFPGCFPFILSQPGTNLRSVLEGLKRYLLPGKDHLKLTFNDERIAHACNAHGIELNYLLFKMVRSVQEVR